MSEDNNIKKQAIDYINQLVVGDELTIDQDLIDIYTGEVNNHKGQKVKIREVWYTDAKWSNLYNQWMPKVVHGVKLEEEYGIYLLTCFSETIAGCD